MPDVVLGSKGIGIGIGKMLSPFGVWDGEGRLPLEFRGQLHAAARVYGLQYLYLFLDILD